MHWGTRNKEIREIKHQQKENNKAWTCFAFLSELETLAVLEAAGSAAWSTSLPYKISVR